MLMTDRRVKSAFTQHIQLSQPFEPIRSVSRAMITRSLLLHVFLEVSEVTAP